MWLLIDYFCFEDFLKFNFYLIGCTNQKNGNATNVPKNILLNTSFFAILVKCIRARKAKVATDQNLSNGNVKSVVESFPTKANFSITTALFIKAIAKIAISNAKFVTGNLSMKIFWIITTAGIIKRNNGNATNAKSRMSEKTSWRNMLKKIIHSLKTWKTNIKTSTLTLISIQCLQCGEKNEHVINIKFK